MKQSSKAALGLSAQQCCLNINKRKTKDLCTGGPSQHQNAAIIGALKFAEFPDHISIDYEWN